MRSPHPDYPSITAGTDNGVRPHLGVVLLVKAALVGNRTLLEQGAEGCFHVRNLGLPSGCLLGRNDPGGLLFLTVFFQHVVGQAADRNVTDYLAVMVEDVLVTSRDPANGDRLKVIKVKDLLDVFLVALVNTEQHPFLGLAEHDFIGRHPAFTLGNQVQV